MEPTGWPLNKQKQPPANTVACTGAPRQEETLPPAKIEKIKTQLIKPRAHARKLQMTKMRTAIAPHASTSGSFGVCWSVIETSNPTVLEPPPAQIGFPSRIGPQKMSAQIAHGTVSGKVPTT